MAVHTRRSTGRITRSPARFRTTECIKQKSKMQIKREFKKKSYSKFLIDVRAKVAVQAEAELAAQVEAEKWFENLFDRGTTHLLCYETVKILNVLDI